MGEAKRRKKLDPNYGNLENSVENNFKVSLESEIKDSRVTAKVINMNTLEEAILQFHIYVTNSKVYAEIELETEDISRYGWVIKNQGNINTLSKIVSKLVMRKTRVAIINS
jgi:hypothetical protein